MLCNPWQCSSNQQQQSTLGRSAFRHFMHWVDHKSVMWYLMYKNKREQTLRANTVLFADGLVLIAASEDQLQRSIYNLNTVTTKYNTHISTERVERNSRSSRKEATPSKICAENRILERVSNFTYLGYTVPYQEVHSRHTQQHIKIRGCIQKLPDWPPGARTANGTDLCHYV